MITKAMAEVMMDAFGAYSEGDISAWIPLVYPLLGEESLKKYEHIPAVKQFLNFPHKVGIEAYCEELAYYYCVKLGPKVKPGFQIAALDDGQYYVSTQAFPAGVNSRTVVAKAREATVYLAIEAAMKNWRSIVNQLEAAG